MANKYFLSVVNVFNLVLKTNKARENCYRHNILQLLFLLHMYILCIDMAVKQSLFENHEKGVL